MTDAFIVGNNREPDWVALATRGTTLVIYMGLSHLLNTVARLIAAGLSPDTPAAAMDSGTLPTQRHVITTLGELPARVVVEGLDSPAIIVVGEVTTLASVAQHAAATYVVADAAARYAA
jgi:uroporphyrin-III C-methyltransferase